MGKAVGLAACTGRPTLGGLLVELLEDPPADTKRLDPLSRFHKPLLGGLPGVFGPAVAMLPAPNVSEAGGPGVACQ